MLVMNATNEIQTVKAFGNYFRFTPKQIKVVDNDIGMFLIEERRDQGIIGIPEAFEDTEYKNSVAGKETLSKLVQAGIDSYVNGLRKLIFNNQVSLRQDLEKANLKVDPAALASEAEIEAMRLVAKYGKAQEDTAQEKVDEVKELMKKVGAVTK